MLGPCILYPYLTKRGTVEFYDHLAQFGVQNIAPLVSNRELVWCELVYIVNHNPWHTFFVCEEDMVPMFVCNDFPWTLMTWLTNIEYINVYLYSSFRDVHWFVGAFQTLDIEDENISIVYLTKPWENLATIFCLTSAIRTCLVHHHM